MTKILLVLKVVRVRQHAKLQAIPSMLCQQTVTKIKSVLKVARIHKHTKFHAIPVMRSQGNAPKPQIRPVSLSQNYTKKGTQ